MGVKLFLICVLGLGCFLGQAAVPVEGIVYFKEGSSIGFSGNDRVYIPKRGRDVKVFRNLFTRDKQKEIYPIEGIDSIVCWHPRTPEHRRKFIPAESIGWYWLYFSTPHICAYVYSGRGYGIASNGGIQVYQRKRIFGRSQVVYYLRKSGDTAYYSLGRVKPRTGNAFRERICRYVADDAALCARIRNSDTWRDKTVLMLRDYHIGNQP